MIVAVHTILAKFSWTSLVCSAKKYKCALGTTISFTTGLWILPGKESWAPDNISTGSLPAKTLQIISSVSSLQQFKLLSLSVPCLFCDWTNVLVCFVYWSVSAGAYLDAGYNPLHVLPGHPRMTHPVPCHRVTAPLATHNFLLHWLSHKASLAYKGSHYQPALSCDQRHAIHSGTRLLNEQWPNNVKIKDICRDIYHFCVIIGCLSDSKIVFIPHHYLLRVPAYL